MAVTQINFEKNLTETNLTLDKVLQIEKIIEAATQHSDKIASASNPPSEELNKLSSNLINIEVTIIKNLSKGINPIILHDHRHATHHQDLHIRLDIK